MSEFHPGEEISGIYIVHKNMDNTDDKNKKKESTVSLRAGKAPQPEKPPVQPEGDFLSKPKSAEDIMLLKKQGKITSEQAEAMFKEWFPIKVTGTADIDADTDTNEKGTGNIRAGVPLPEGYRARRVKAAPEESMIYDTEFLTKSNNYKAFLDAYKDTTLGPEERVKNWNMLKESLKQESAPELKKIYDFFKKYVDVSQDNPEDARIEQELLGFIIDEYTEKNRE